MNLILSADANWAIGRDGDLLFRTKGDMQYFRRMTAGKVVVMGRRTLESLPGGKPLPQRKNVVLTRDTSFACAGAVVCHSLPALFQELAQHEDGDILVIGGEQIYRQLMPYCRLAYITRWQAGAQADSHVPDFDAADGWRLAERSPRQEEDGIAYHFCTYAQDRPTPWRDAL